MEVLLNLIYTVQKFKSFSNISLNNDLNYSDFGHYCHFNPFKPNIEILAFVVTYQYNVALLIICFPLYSLHTPSYTTSK